MSGDIGVLPFDSNVVISNGYCNTTEGGGLLFPLSVLGLLLPIAIGLFWSFGIRRKNSLTAVMHTVTAVFVGSFIWLTVGFGITFGQSLGDVGFIGTLDWTIFVEPGLPECYAGVPLTLFAFYQMSFALMAFAIVSGSWAEKLRYDALFIVAALWPLLVYYFVAHWLWNPAGWLSLGVGISGYGDDVVRNAGAVDYAGGLVVLTTASISALVATIIIPGRPPALREPFNNPMHIFTGFFALLAWYGMIAARSTFTLQHFETPSLLAGKGAGHALVGAHLAAAGGAITWALLGRALERRWHARELVHGALAGVSAVAVGVGYQATFASLTVGVVGALLAFATRGFLRSVLWLDDPLGSVSTFGAPAIFGAITVAFLARREYGAPRDGLFYDLNEGGLLLRSQVVAVLCVIAWSAVLTTILLLIVKAVLGSLDRNEAAETPGGLDRLEIGEESYASNKDDSTTLSPQQRTARAIHCAASGNTGELKRLLDDGTPAQCVDYDYRTPAHFAAFQGHNNVLELLYKHNVDLDARDNYGSTPMHAAVAHGHQHTVKWLLDHGATPVAAAGAPRVRTMVPGTVQAVNVKQTAGVDANLKQTATKTTKTTTVGDGHISVETKKETTTVDADGSEEYEYEYEYVSEEVTDDEDSDDDSDDDDSDEETTTEESSE